MDRRKPPSWSWVLLCFERPCISTSPSKSSSTPYPLGVHLLPLRRQEARIWFGTQSYWLLGRRKQRKHLTSPRIHFGHPRSNFEIPRTSFIVLLFAIGSSLLGILTGCSMSSLGVGRRFQSSIEKYVGDSIVGEESTTIEKLSPT